MKLCKYNRLLITLKSVYNKFYISLDKLIRILSQNQVIHHILIHNTDKHHFYIEHNYVELLIQGFGQLLAITYNNYEIDLKQIKNLIKIYLKINMILAG